jgi:hypothetical protein
MECRRLSDKENETLWLNEAAWLIIDVALMIHSLQEIVQSTLPGYKQQLQAVV